MIQTTLPSVLATPASSLSVSPSVRTQPTQAASGDTVSFSKLAVIKSRMLTATRSQTATATDNTSPNLWETQYNLKSGTVYLKNGHRQETSISGTELSILEYDGENLVRKETGSIYNGNVIKDIEEFDKNGELTRRVHAELYAGQGSGKTSSLSSLHRDIQWFTDGQLTQELHDDMRVNATYKLIDALDGNDVPMTTDNLQDLTGTITKDIFTNDYFANITQYNIYGKIFQETSIAQITKTVNETNRSNKAYNEIASHRTTELANSTDLSINQTRYDNDGDMVFQASLQDTLVKDVSQSQQISVNSYADGNLVEENRILFTQKKAEGHLLRQRPNVFETLGLTEGQFSSSRPMDAEELLQKGHGSHVDDASTMFKATLDDMAKGNFNSAQDMVQEGASDTPHSILWQKTLYQDGKQVLRQEDSEEVWENPLPDTTGFRTCTGLTEDKDPVNLRSVHHSLESYQDGQLRGHTSVSMQERAVDDARGMTRTETSVFTSSGNGFDSRDTSFVLADALANVDANRDAAAQKADKTIQTVIDDVREAFGTLSRSNSYDLNVA